MTVPRALAPLRHVRYRWLAGSLALSLLSAGLWLLAMVWQTVELGGGPSAVSAVSGASGAGLLVTVLLGGALADRLSQTRILVTIELVRGVALAVVAVLSLLGWLSLWQLVAVGLLGGLVSGMYFPAYSALLPSILPADHLLAANGLENALRPVLVQATGPAAAGVVVAAVSPGAAIALAAVAALAAGGCVLALARCGSAGDGPSAGGAPAGGSPAGGSPADAPPADDAAPAVVGTAEADRAAAPARTNPIRTVLRDVGEGMRYMVATRWLFATLVFASLMILVILGPFEVLTPFAVRDRLGGGAGEHATILVAYGLAAAAGSLAIASRPMPRRYLTLMVSMWSLGCVPAVAFGLADHLWVMVLAAAAMGALSNAPMVVWGTLLQRRVPPSMLGRVSSLDFFVSLSLLPVSMALAGPVGEHLGLTTTFLFAGLLPLLIGAVTLLVGRLGADELAHPLDPPAPLVPGTDAEQPVEERAAQPAATR